MCEDSSFCKTSTALFLDDSCEYNPDILNLNQDTEAANYWFNCFKDLINKFAKQAVKSQQNDPTAEQRAKDFKNEYMHILETLQNEINKSEKPLTIRTLLNLNESLLRRHGFNDPWFEQKRLENDASIAILKSRLNEIDSLENYEEKWYELIRGLLAGNIFDWGAQIVSEILQNNQKFGLHDALKKIQSRPWLIDDFDVWLERLKGSPHKCAVIFVDNSGADIILGVIPFARELLLRKTKVILCANTEPSLNDITYKELEDVLDKCCCICDILLDARKNQRLLVYSNGQNGPCLDMRNLSKELCNAIKTNETDLLVIEGMGRAVHTNLYSKFCCETLKLAVIKNEWLANRLGGDTFSVICKYERI